MKRVSGHALMDYRRLLSAIAATVSIAFVPSPFADWLVLAALVAGIFIAAKLVQMALY